MALAIRRRGEVWHARGTVRVGRETIHVREYSTGARSRADALAAAATEEARIRAEILDGAAGRARRLTLADAIEAYARRPGGIPSYDLDRLGRINTAVGARVIADAATAWSDVQRAIGGRWSPATAARWRAIYVAALRAGCAALGLPTPPAVPTVREPRADRIATLPPAEREALLRAYSAAAAAPLLLLAYAGLRSQEALRLDWRDVDFARRQLRVRASKTGTIRAVPMHRRVDALLYALHQAAGAPARGPVFHSSRGEPYADTRGRGGNPLRSAHRTACAATGISGFRIHDWRHDYATRFLAAGGDVRALMQVMGWESPRMVQRYVTFRADHLAEIQARVA